MKGNQHEQLDFQNRQIYETHTNESTLESSQQSFSQKSEVMHLQTQSIRKTITDTRFRKMKANIQMNTAESKPGKSRKHVKHFEDCPKL